MAIEEKTDIQNINLSNITYLNILEWFPKEKYNATDIITCKNNLDVLMQCLNFDLEVESYIQKNRLDYNVSLVSFCRNYYNPSDNVLIACSFEDSTYSNVYDLLSHMAKFKYDTAIYVCAKLDDRSKSILEYLNNVSNQRLKIYGVEVQLIQIDSSRPAFIYNIVVQPHL